MQESWISIATEQILTGRKGRYMKLFAFSRNKEVVSCGGRLEGQEFLLKQILEIASPGER